MAEIASNIYLNAGLIGLICIGGFLLVWWVLKTSIEREEKAYAREKEAHDREKEYQEIVKQQNEIIIALSDQLPDIRSKLEDVLLEVRK